VAARELVVGCDGSDGAEAALEVAITAARELGDRLVLVFGYEPPGRMVGDEFKAHLRALEEYGAGSPTGSPRRLAPPESRRKPSSSQRARQPRSTAWPANAGRA
jgi:nucleotide-binding universal stress UspA family protein